MAEQKTQPAFRQKNAPRRTSVPGNGLALAPRIEDADDPVATWENISPQTARIWLDRTPTILNRSVNKPFVDGLRAAIQRGEWRKTGDTIKHDKDGNVIDGQHRLLAIEASGFTVRALVVRGIEEEAFDVMDTGRSRSIGDVLHIRGYANRNELGTTVRNLITLEKFGRVAISTRDSRMLVTPVTTLDYIHKHPEVQQAVNLAMFVRKADLPGGVGLWASLLEMFRRINVEDVAEFTHALVTGEGLERGDPVLVLRNHMLTKKEMFLTQRRRDREELAGAIIRTWNAWRNHDEVVSWRQIEWKADSARGFPVPA